MERAKKPDGGLEKDSDQRSVGLAVFKEERGLISRFRAALAGLFAGEEKPAIKLSEEDASQIRASMIKCSDKLRMLHDKADAQFTGPVFERIDRSGRMEEDYLVYDDVKEYMIYNCQTDLELWEAFEKYLSKIDEKSEAKKMFINSGDFASIINIFGSHSRICGEVFKLIFTGNIEKARAMLACSRLPARKSELGLSIITKLLEQDAYTIALFLDLMAEMPKKFICNESRAELLIEFAARHKDRAELTSGKEAAEYIVQKESETHPYR